MNLKIPTGIRAILDARGCTQAWVINRMNNIDSSLEMNRSKLSAIVCGSRKITGDELLAFCIATETDPNYFCEVANRAGASGQEGR